MQISDALAEEIYQTLTKLAEIPQLIGKMKLEAAQWQAMQQAAQKAEQQAAQAAQYQATPSPEPKKQAEDLPPPETETT